MQAAFIDPPTECQDRVSTVDVTAQRDLVDLTSATDTSKTVGAKLYRSGPVRW